MRVLLCTDTLNDVNGVCRFIRDVARYQHRLGRDLTVVTSTRVPAPPGEVLPPNVKILPPIFSRPMPGYPQLELACPPAWALISLACKLRPDIIHLSTPGPVGWAGLIASRVVNCPVIGVYHTNFPAYIQELFGDEGMTAATQSVMKVFYHRFAAVLCRSPEYRSVLAGLGVAGKRIRTLQPGVDTQTFHPRHRDAGMWKMFGMQESSIKVLSVGRVSVEKNLPFLTNVWRRARERLLLRDIKAELVVIGDGPFRSAMEEKCRGLDVHFLGFRFGEMLAKLYASSDLFVFPSTTDTLGQVAMESQASGLPALVSDQGGPKVVVQDQLTGLILPAGKEEAWVRAIEQLCIDADRRKAMGSAAHAAMQHMSISESLEAFWSIHQSVAGIS